MLLIFFTPGRSYLVYALTGVECRRLAVNSILRKGITNDPEPTIDYYRPRIHDTLRYLQSKH